MAEIEFESATEFLTRPRGRVRARWIMVPVAIAWLVAAAIALDVARARRPELMPYQAGLYLCTAFFVHAYVVAWRSGSILWRYSALALATLFYAVLCFVHADDASAWVIYTETGVTQRPPEQRLFVSVTLNTLSALLLLVHGFFLGLGSRTPASAGSAGAADVESTAAAEPEQPEPEQPEPEQPEPERT